MNLGQTAQKNIKGCLSKKGVINLLNVMFLQFFTVVYNFLYLVIINKIQSYEKNRYKNVITKRDIPLKSVNKIGSEYIQIQTSY